MPYWGKFFLQSSFDDYFLWNFRLNSFNANTLILHKNVHTRSPGTNHALKHTNIINKYYIGNRHCSQEMPQGKHIRLMYTRIQRANITFIKIMYKEPTTKYRKNIPRRPSHDSRENRRELTAQYNTTLPLQLCPYVQFADITRTCTTHSARLVCLETKTSSDS